MERTSEARTEGRMSQHPVERVSLQGLLREYRNGIVKVTRKERVAYIRGSVSRL